MDDDTCENIDNLHKGKWRWPTNNTNKVFVLMIQSSECRLGGWEVKL